MIKEFHAGSCDVAVIGAGHAGIEAALASARLGMDTICFTVNLDSVGNMPCNPAIGGTGKGHLVRELDALGGEMGRAADKACIQYRMLNQGKGPAVHSLRAQADRRRYQEVMKHTLELQENLQVKQAEVVSIEVEAPGQESEKEGAVPRVCSVTTATGARYLCRAVIIATGTYLDSRTIVGELLRPSGPDGLAPAIPLSDCLRGLGLPLRRFKTGTPPRVNTRSVDFSKMELQAGDEHPEPFSFSTEQAPENRAVCYLTWTNEETHRIIRENLDRSPIYSGVIEGVGPRYCPSIETKVMTFPDKLRHQLFVEPMGLNTEELYIQGFSSSMPEEVQLRMLHTVPGLEHAEMTRCAYAIEYDCVDPLALSPSLEFTDLPGLFGAGQFNGSSGYEEAAAQGLVAGINAARRALGKEPIVLERSGSYIGTLIDDLVTKGCNEPYRMMTSRSEYRLVLRQDNADLRLSDLGYEIGLLPKARHDALEEKRRQIAAERARVEKTVIAPGEGVNEMLVSRETSPLTTGAKLSDLLKRPQLSYDSLTQYDPSRPDLDRSIFEQVELDLKYEGYIKHQQQQINEMRRLEVKLLPDDIDYSKVTGLRLEAIEKLGKIRPENIGRASRISGVSPADINVLLIYLERGAGND
jgi:tRNA uridine 5-carboxymethylaminomethyl modification enzyme